MVKHQAIDLRGFGSVDYVAADIHLILDHVRAMVEIASGTFRRRRNIPRVGEVAVRDPRCTERNQFFILLRMSHHRAHRFSRRSKGSDHRSAGFSAGTGN